MEANQTSNVLSIQAVHLWPMYGAQYHDRQVSLPRWIGTTDDWIDAKAWGLDV